MQKISYEKCKFHFRKFFSHWTIVAELLPANIPEEIKIQVLRDCNDLLSKVKSYTDTELNPSKKILYDYFRSGYENVKSINKILPSLEISRAEYLESNFISI